MSAIDEAEPRTVSGPNSVYDWSQFDIDGKYVPRNYGELTPEDHAVADGVIDRICMLPDEYFSSLGSLRDIGTGGVLRTSALAAPLLRRETSVLLTDRELPQLVKIQKAVDKVKSGDIGDWAAHEEAMAARDQRWAGAVSFIGSKALVGQQNLWELPKESTQVATEGHCLESSTGDKEEYLAGAASFYKSIEPGGIAVRLFMIRSTGYRAGQEYPAVSITPEDIDSEARAMGMIVVGGAFGVEANHTHDARDKDDPTTYDGFGGAVLLKPRSTTATVLLGNRIVGGSTGC